MVEETDEILAITLGGGVIRTRVNEVRETGRDTMGVQLINLGKRDAVVGIARNAEAGREAAEVDDSVDTDAEGGTTAAATAEATTAEAAAGSTVDSNVEDTSSSTGEHEE